MIRVLVFRLENGTNGTPAYKIPVVVTHNINSAEQYAERNPLPRGQYYKFETIESEI
jgi:hypothetical protein